MHQALPAIGHEVRLRLAPAAERRRPLLGPAHVEHVLAHLDHRAVHDARRRSATPRRPSPPPSPRRARRHRAPGRRRARAPGPGRDGRTPSDPRRRSATPIASASVNSARALPVSPANRCPSATGTSSRPRSTQSRSASSSRCSARASQPPAGAISPAQEQAEAEPERAPGRPPRVTAAQALVMSSLARGRPDVVLAGEVRRHRQPLQIVDIQRRSAVGGGQLDVRHLSTPAARTSAGPTTTGSLTAPSISHRGRWRHQVRHNRRESSTRITLAPARPRLMCRRVPSNTAAAASSGSPEWSPSERERLGPRDRRFVRHA